MSMTNSRQKLLSRNVKIMGFVTGPQGTVKRYLQGKENFLPRTCNPTNMGLMYLGQGVQRFRDFSGN
jgi:hypothetical protein